MSVEKKYWFPAKRYGWGWGIPNVWQGWLVLFGDRPWAGLTLLALLGQYQLSQSSLAQTVDGAVVFNFNLLGARKQRSTGYACYARGGYWSLVH